MSKIMIPRRSFLAGAASFIAAPAIVRPESLMKIKPTLFVQPKIVRAVNLQDIARLLLPGLKESISIYERLPDAYDLMGAE